MIDRLRADSARAIAYDFQLRDETDPTDDNALFEAVGRANGVVLATATWEPGSTPILGGDREPAPRPRRAASINFPNPPHAGGIFRRVCPTPTAACARSAAVAAERAMGHPVDRSRFSGDGAWIDFAGGRARSKTVLLAT